MTSPPSRNLPRVAPLQLASRSTARNTATRARRVFARLALIAILAGIALITPGSALADWDTGAVSADPTEAAPGDVVTFTATIAWTSDGFSSSASASFDSTIPAEFTSVSWSCSGTNFTCESASGSGNSISVGGTADDIFADASATVTITATVADDAAEGPVDISVCMSSSTDGGGVLTSSGVRALPNLQDGCSTVTVNITAAPTPTPEPTEEPTQTPTPEPTGEPTETATAEPTPATPVIDPTETPVPSAPNPAPQNPAPPVTQLPSTGSGERADLRAITMNGLTVLLALAAFVIAGLRLRKRA